MDELPPAQERINEIRRRRREHIFPGVTTYYDQSLVVDRAEGMYVYGMDGRQYLDFFAGILTVQVGHCDPEITQAVVDQLHKVWHTSTVFDTEPMGLVAEKLAQLAPGDLTHTFFCNSGTEANETAVMLAQLFTRNPEILAFRHSYHGRSAVALSLTGQAAWRKGANLPGVRHIPSPYCYRCPYGQEPESCNLQCVKEIEEIIQTTTSGEIAGFIAEPILGLGGLITPPDDYFKEAVPIIRRYGGLFIADEVQTGFGRTGTYMFGIQHWGVEPDIMTFAKGIANGLPVGATLARADVAAALKPPTISTFGGNPVSMAGAWATIQVLENRGLVDNARVQGERLRQGLLALQEEFPVMGDVRGKGLMLGVELVKDPETKEPAPDLAVAVMQAAKDEGLLIGRGGLYNNVLRITPPLSVSAGQIDDALAMLKKAMTAALAAVGGD
ncbi:MAG TPA: aspartate aminotransferase family protein [Sphingobacteriaceae bacterium]|nr:aspartate aminotransferase family protein [Sphingobacteriaceae bacterium]